MRDEDYSRSLTVDEIARLEHAGCTAADWSLITVAEDFDASCMRDVEFHGRVALGVYEKSIEAEPGLKRPSGIRGAVLSDVTVGDNCLIENIGCLICRYDIGDDCYISNVGRLSADADATFGTGNTISVMNEAGTGNIVVYGSLTSNVAALMVSAGSEALLAAARRQAEAERPQRGTIGSGVKIVNTREVVNTFVGSNAEISGASRLSDCMISGRGRIGVYVGSDVICENTVIADGASLTDGAKVYNSFVGEACHIGRGFTAESSVFFANSYMDNGEACAAFCGPFSVSHHKSTLLIGGMYSFYNAGSGTNYSNHAYKIGPVHYGTLRRGSKTASGAHLLWPAEIGAFSVCLGKIHDHPDTSALPFSYVFGSEEGTIVVPAANSATAGIYRDMSKWVKRDKRPKTDRHDIVNLDRFGPYVMQHVIEGKQLLERLLDAGETKEGEYAACGVRIRKSSVAKGIRRYDTLAKMFFADALRVYGTSLPESAAGTGRWVDLGGMLAPESEVQRLVDEINAGEVPDIAAVEERLGYIHDRYDEYRRSYVYTAVLRYFGIDGLTDEDVSRIEAAGTAAETAWKADIAKDAEKEAGLGDVDETVLRDFIASLS